MAAWREMQEQGLRLQEESKVFIATQALETVAQKRAFCRSFTQGPLKSYMSDGML